mmetsp:Transcript_4383/g.9902  ORF Transcript_4383/g.9902 Transcript_4383/m.9902 type:complete len:218 (-) Transcript_4383:44-697(-)
MATPIDNTRHGINKCIVFHTTPNKAFEIVNVCPSLVVRLKRSDPIEHSSYPFQLGMVLPSTNCTRILTKINVRISTVSSFIGCFLAQEIVKHAKVAYSSCLYHSPAPPTATLHIRPPIPILHWLLIHKLSTLLPHIIHTILRRILPRMVAHVTIIPMPSERILALGTTIQRTRRSIPIRLRGCFYLHVQINLALHMLTTLRTDILLITLFQLSTSVG